MKQTTTAAGHTAKHTPASTAKHKQAKPKHNPKQHPKAAGHHAAGKAAPVHTAAKPAKGAKPRKLSPGSAVACCSAEALAASLRLSGRVVGADDVLALYWRTAGDPDAGASILATLEAAAEFGLAGVRPVSFRPVDALDNRALIGCTLPGGPHAVLAETGRWWSWSQPWPPAAFHDAVIEEAWAVTWP